MYLFVQCCDGGKGENPRRCSGAFSYMRQLAAFGLVIRDDDRLCLAYLCYDSAPSGESLLPANTHRAKLPENPSDITVSGQNGLIIHGWATVTKVILNRRIPGKLFRLAFEDFTCTALA